MLDIFQPKHPFEGQSLRLAAEAQQGGGDVFDVVRTARTLTPGDIEGWERAWLTLAQQTEEKARTQLALGHRNSAMHSFFAANQYYRQSDVFIHDDLDRKAERFRKSQELFREGAKFHFPKIEVVTVRCGDEEYDGYFCHPLDPKPGKWPAIFMIGGADAFAEEIFFSGRQILERGWAMLLVDTPGRGSSSYLKRIPTRADYEVPGRACIDWLVARPEVDAARIGVIGISMAGYYAPRVAAYDERVKALIGWCGCYSILDDLYSFFAPLQPTMRRLLGGVDDATARRQLKDFSMAEAAPRIQCPTLITHGVNDQLMNVEGAKKLFDALGTRDKQLKLYDGPGAGHCQYAIWGESIPHMLDWMEERL